MTAAKLLRLAIRDRDVLDLTGDGRSNKITQERTSLQKDSIQYRLSIYLSVIHVGAIP